MNKKFTYYLLLIRGKLFFSNIAFMDPEDDIEIEEPVNGKINPTTPRLRDGGLEGGIIDSTAVFEQITTIMTRSYCDNYIYRNTELERVLNDYGYYGDTCYYYHIKDYQGNIRATINHMGTLKEINNYYPYGGLMGQATSIVQPYKYNSKELDRENGLDWYDFAARRLDPMLTRFATPDPKCEHYYSLSPYTYCAANPIRFTDPTGRYFEEQDYQIGFERISYALDKIQYIQQQIENGTYGLFGSIEDGQKRIEQLKASVVDFYTMAADKTNKFKIHLINVVEYSPETRRTGSHEYTLYIPQNIDGMTFHEFAHGAQISIGEFDYYENSPNENYGVSHEITAYKRQYAYDGYIYVYGKRSEIGIHNMDKITKRFIKKIYENGVKIYNYGDEWYNK